MLRLYRLVVAAVLSLHMACLIAAEDFALKENNGEGKTQTIANSIGMTLRLIPAGEFMMGSPKNDEKQYVGYETQHRVKLSRPFYLGTTEVTQRQWTAVMETEPWKGRDHVKEAADHAATYISWSNAVEFCRRLSKKEGKVYRLPTEAEWEYACRAGTSTRYGFGNDESKLADYAWFYKNAADIDEFFAHQVGRKRPNAWGLYDMHGNVGEWCGDWFGADYYDKSPGADPKGPATGSERIYRGGTWISNARRCRAANRGWHAPYGHYSIGFRVVLVPSSE